MVRGVRATVVRSAVVLLASCLPIAVQAIDASDRYRSPRNPERKIRRSTELIVLHTTEAPARSSLNKLSDRGEAHFCVTEDGSVYRIVDRDREAFHAGRSMWNGKEDVDKFSIGIECVGYHNKPMSQVQLYAIRDLVKELKSMYHLGDERVVCHSHVAYGAPNKWQKRRHRGRKRCGMLFAMPSVRRVLGLRYRPGGDPDTRAGRLVVGDPYLCKVLYGNVDTMVASCPPAKREASPLVAKTPPKVPPKTPPKKTSPPKIAVPNAIAQESPAVKKPEPIPEAPQNAEQLKAGGWKLAGTISKKVSALRIAGSRWDDPKTYYVLGGKLTPGDKVNPQRFVEGMEVWLKTP